LLLGMFGFLRRHNPAGNAVKIDPISTFHTTRHQI
jgi:hypothetical protein